MRCVVPCWSGAGVAYQGNERREGSLMLLPVWNYTCLLCGARFLSLVLFSVTFHEHCEHCTG